MCIRDRAPVVQLIDAETNEILYTVRAKGKTFTPGAPLEKTFLVKAGKNAPDTVISKNAKVGSAPQTVSLP